MKFADARIAIVTPVGGGQLWANSVAAGYAESIRRVQANAPQQVIAYNYYLNGELTRARNRAAAHVLRELRDVTHVLWWDADNWIEDPKLTGHPMVDGGVEMISAMVESGEDVVAGAYTRKRYPIAWTHTADHTAKEIGKLLVVQDVAFGFCLTSTACLAKLSANTRPQDVYTDHGFAVPNIFGQVYDWVVTADGVKARALLTEDYSFCRRWQSLGGRVTLWMEGIVMHSGPHNFSARDRAGAVL